MKKITRRDFINGSAVAVGATTLPSPLAWALAAEGEAYPPALTGLRGNHPGSNTMAHARAWNADFDLDQIVNLRADTGSPLLL